MWQEIDGETSRPLGTRLREHEYNLRQGNVEKSKLAAHAIEEGHRIDGNPPRQTDRQTDRQTYKLNLTTSAGNTKKQHMC